MKEPLLAKSLTTKPKLGVKKVYEYDLQTVAGGEYRVYRKGTATSVQSNHKSQSSILKPQTNEVYDLKGQQVSHPNKGLFIINGKKVKR